MIRRFLPKTLFARALLIVVLPTVLVQLVTAYVFYVRHWDSVTRNMASSLAGDIAFLASQTEHTPENERKSLAQSFGQSTGLRSEFEPGKALEEKRLKARRDFPEFTHMLETRVDYPISVRRLRGQDMVEVKLQMPEGVLSVTSPLKRLESGTTNIFLLWMTGSSLIFLCIAVVFLRNQVRPIRQLAEAAESFGKGQEKIDFHPHGAQEVRRAARAFLVMRERILRQIRSRTEMLAGISHDLRTPLTRMKLQLAMLPASAETEGLADDVTQMEHMISEYLQFARGDGGEETQRISAAELLQDVVGDYQRSGKDIPLEVRQDAMLELRVVAFRRMMHNLIDNALRHGKSCTLAAAPMPGRFEIVLDDNGPGIPEDKREEVFMPFKRLDASRNPKTGGVGLGLSIARDIARSHGGNIELADAASGGLRVVVRLPL